MLRTLGQCFFIFALFTPAAFAKVTSPDSCEALLDRSAIAVDYAASDLEGLFLHLVKKVGAASEVQPDRLAPFAHDVLNLKAELLNNIGALIPSVRILRDQKRMGQLAISIYGMLQAVGVDSEPFGLKIDEQGNLEVQRQPPAAVSSSDKSPPSLAPIGFRPKEGATESDLPDGLHRSIGFAPPSYRVEAPPARHVGNIRYSTVQDRPELIAVVDGETNQTYIVPLSVLRAGSAQVEGKTLNLAFNSDVFKWVLLVQNLNNPSGHIGFL